MQQRKTCKFRSILLLCHTKVQRVVGNYIHGVVCCKECKATWDKCGVFTETGHHPYIPNHAAYNPDSKKVVTCLSVWWQGSVHHHQSKSGGWHQSGDLNTNNTKDVWQYRPSHAKEHHVCATLPASHILCLKEIFNTHLVPPATIQHTLIDWFFLKSALQSRDMATRKTNETGCNKRPWVTN